MSKITITVKDKAGHTSSTSASFTVTSTVPAGLTAPDGGLTDPYKGKMPGDPNFLPIGVWYESVLDSTNIAKDKDTGLNLYVELTDNSDPALIKNAGMYAIHSNTKWAVGTETAGWLITDEVDMWAGPGTAAWSGKFPGQGDICNPATGKCGYTVLDALKKGLPADTRLRYANYGKGVMFWESYADASKFVNYQDIVSNDIYWFTDANCMGQYEGGSMFANGSRALTIRETRRASNYGAVVQKMRSLVLPLASKPIWGFVEVGGPFTENTTLASYIQPREVQAAVWHSLIGGARGILYFNHSFGGPNQTQHALREAAYAAVQAAVKTTNTQIKQLAHVFNGSFAQFSTAPTGNVKASLRYSHVTNKYYIIAGNADGRGGTATTSEFTVPVQTGTVTVEFENRTIPIVNGKFSDGFADVLTTHVYRIN